MKSFSSILTLFITCTILLITTLRSNAQGTAFTYQGRLSDAGNPVNGTNDLIFTLMNAASGGSSVGSSNSFSDLPITNGLFTVILNFGSNVFDGSPRWLQISVRPGSSSGSYTDLTPRQAITASPYAITASNLSGTVSASQLVGTVPSAQLGGTYSSAVTFNNSGNSFTGNGGGLTNINAATLGGFGPGSFWKLLGNGGTTAGLNFVGTTDNQPLEFKVNGQRTFRFEPTSSTPNLIGGYAGNFVSGAVGGTISGGGTVAAQNMIATDFADPTDFGTVGGGTANAIRGGQHATIGGGSSNTIAWGDFGTIGGGVENELGRIENTGYADYSTVGGGSANLVRGGRYATIGGGSLNRIYTSHTADYATIAGGVSNVVESLAATIGGGQGNYIYSTFEFCGWQTIGGGYQNVLGGKYGTIGGGSYNQIAGNCDLSFGSYYCTIGGGANNYIGQFQGGSCTIAGGSGNQIDFPLPGSTGGSIGGGGGNIVHAGFGTISGGQNNEVTNVFASIAGGISNSAGGSSSFIGGGLANRTEVADYSSIAGGSGNRILAGNYAAIGGGHDNEIGFAGSGTFGTLSTIAGGTGNRIYQGYATIGGGRENSITASGFPQSGATIAGGLNNSIFAAESAVIAGGQSNRIDTTCRWGTIGGGLLNANSGRGATIAGGVGNTIIGDCEFGLGNYYSTIGGGVNNFIPSSTTGGFTISGGSDNQVAGSVYDGWGTIGGGRSNVVDNTLTTIPGGAQSKAFNYGQMTYASGAFAWTGDAQTSVHVCRNITTNGTVTALFLDGLSERMNVQTNSTWTFDILITGRASGGNSAAYQIRGAIKNNSGTTSIVGSPNVLVLAEDVTTWTANVVADDANDSLQINVTGAAATSIRWVASVRAVEVTY